MNMHNIDFTRAPRNPPSCQECGSPTHLGLSDTCYPDEPDLHGRPMWVCGCGAFGNCEPGTIIPKSRPASALTRAMRHEAYKGFRDKRLSITGQNAKERSLKRNALYRGAVVAMGLPGRRKLQFGWIDTIQAAKLLDYLLTLP